MRGGKREGSGRKQKPEEFKAKTKTFRLYDWEIPKVKQYIRILRKINIIENETPPI